MDSAETLRRRKGTEPETEKEEQEEEVKKSVPSNSALLSFDFAFLLVATIVIGFVIYHYDLLTDPRPKVLSKDQLAEFNGEDGSPLYIAILGEVYDVSKGEKYYGKDKGYYCFVGRDATRAYVSGEFVKDLTDDIEDFTAEKHGGLAEWRQFYRDHKEYSFVGRVVGRFYDEKGHSTEALKKVEDGALQAEEIKKQQEEAKKLHPSCNSRWAQGKGGQVWCKEGYPRMIVEYFPGAEPKKRCACFPDTEHSNQKQLYDDCSPDATLCKIPPKENKT